MSRNAGWIPGTMRDKLMGMTEIERQALKGGAVAIEPLAVRLPDAVRISGLSRSELYRRAARGEIKFLKCGTSTLVDVSSLRAAVAGLPRAELRPEKGVR
jgi:hypothetical protein